jgi:hypothetical protein
MEISAPTVKDCLRLSRHAISDYVCMGKNCQQAIPYRYVFLQQTIDLDSPSSQSGNADVWNRRQQSQPHGKQRTLNEAKLTRSWRRQF